jgi:hypothetical protein
MTAQPALLESEALHERVRTMVHAFEHARPAPEPFDTIAADLARFQAAHVPGYRRLCEARGVAPQAIVRAEQAPAVPTDAFKLARVFAFDEVDATVTFRTSGTSTGARGTHRMRDAGTYDAAALAFGRSMLARDLVSPVPVLVLGPAPDNAPDSSLAHMCALFAYALGTNEATERTFFVRDGLLAIAALQKRIARLPRGTPAVVLATSFALVHVLDALGNEVLELPRGSRVMQTGGFKGRSREVGATELRREVARAFALDERAIIGEYGMAELSSQFWETTLIDEVAPRGVYAEPPWARVVAVDPDTLAPVGAGETGIARVEDLANVDSAFAVLTQDRVRRVAGGFELVGRLQGAPPRGCSIAIDEMLSPHEGPA